jgi:predicted O-methyltransferase YrrM
VVEKIVSEFLNNILTTGKIEDAAGNVLDLHSHTSREQCAFIQTILKQTDARRCLEVGLAYGISSLAICEIIHEKDDATLYSIDPQQDWWQDIGLNNITQAGYGDILQFQREYSSVALPRLAAADTSLDFAYVDTTKLFDVVLIDAMYILKMLKVGGVLVLDDCAWPGINRVARFIAKMPHVKTRGCFNNRRPGWKETIISKIANIIPRREIIFTDRILNSRLPFGADVQCIAFEKISEDNRNWDWFANF